MAAVTTIKNTGTTEEPKRKRGRPKKKPKELPKFKSDLDIKKYLIQQGLKLSLELMEVATKKNNIKKPEVARAKTQQYKTALESLKTVSYLLKDKDETEEKKSGYYAVSLTEYDIMVTRPYFCTLCTGFLGGAFQ